MIRTFAKADSKCLRDLLRSLYGLVMLIPVDDKSLAPFASAPLLSFVFEEKET